MNDKTVNRKDGPAENVSDQFEEWKRGGKKSTFRIGILGIVLLVVFFFSFNFGRYSGISSRDIIRIMLSKVITISADWPENYEKVVLLIRFPRIFSAVLIGAALALSGAAYQAVFKNPLVSPDIMGASSGASLGLRWRFSPALGIYGFRASRLFSAWARSACPTR